MFWCQEYAPTFMDTYLESLCIINLLGLGQQTAYSPRGLRWHLCDDGQGDPFGPHCTISVDPGSNKGCPVWQGFSRRGRHIGTGGHGWSVHETSTSLQASPSSKQEISAQGSLQLQVGQPDESIWKPYGHGAQRKTGQLLGSLLPHAGCTSGGALVPGNSSPLLSTHQHCRVFG